ncbi:MAG: hypothetical protein J6W28_02105 [Clostridia bacterium]|nr:hypothetical protein [Clostridia bacterium]
MDYFKISCVKFFGSFFQKGTKSPPAKKEQPLCKIRQSVAFFGAGCYNGKKAKKEALI